MIKQRIFPESNYKAIHCNNKTMRIALDSSKPITELKYCEFLDVDIFETNNGRCRAKCNFCFLPNEKVNVSDKLINIQDININDVVGSFDISNGEFVMKNVDQLFKSQYVGDIISIMLEDGRIINSTENHRFYTTNRGWVEAKELDYEDDLFVI